MRAFRDIGWLLLALSVGLLATAVYIYLQWTHAAISTQFAGLATTCCAFAAASFLVGAVCFLRSTPRTPPMSETAGREVVFTPARP